MLALVTTVHLALASLRNHRSAGSAPISSKALLSLAFAALPWVFSTPSGLMAGLGVHLIWFFACEALAPAPPARPSVRTNPSVPPVAPRVQGRHAGPAAAPRSAAAKGFVQVPVLCAFDETPAIKTIRVARPEGFDFDAGQFITVRVRVDGQEYARCYSISSAPHVSGYLEFSVRRQGLVSNALHTTARPGAALFVKSPAGAFRYPAGDDRPMVLLAGGIGVTPLVSMLRHALAAEPTRPVVLLYCARTLADFAFRDELATAARRHPQFRLCLAVSGGSTDPAHYSGRIDEPLLRTMVPDLAHSIALICGPGDMIAGMRSLLAGLGVPAPQIRYEVFQAAVAASSGLREEAGDAHGGSQHSAGATGGRRSADREMHCSQTRKTVRVKGGQTILEAAEDGGVPVDSLCRAGVCGTCKVHVSAGEVDCASATLDDDEREQGFVLACVSTLRTDCTVSL